MERILKTEKELRDILNAELKNKCNQFEIDLRYSILCSFGHLSKRKDEDAEGCNWPKRVILNGVEKVPQEPWWFGSRPTDDQFVPLNPRAMMVQIMLKVIKDAQEIYNMEE